MSMPYECTNGLCFYCGRQLVCAVPLPPAKANALKLNRLSCGPCIHVHGRLPFKEGRDYIYSWRRLRLKRAARSGTE